MTDQPGMIPAKIPMLERILFNEIPVKDIQKAISWYKDALYKHLKDNQVQVEEIIDDGEGNRFLHFYDLCGINFAFNATATVQEPFRHVTDGG